jgi:amino acid transporter
LRSLWPKGRGSSSLLDRTTVYGWLATIAGTLCLVVVLNRLARDMAGGCGPFTYPAAAFGPGVGFMVAWSYWISIWVTNAALAIAVVRNLAFVLPGLSAPAFGAAVAIGVIWLFALVNCLGVRAAGGVQVLTTSIKLVPLAGAILIACWALGTGREALVPYDSQPISLAGINSAVTFALFAMLGFEAPARRRRRKPLQPRLRNQPPELLREAPQAHFARRRAAPACRPARPCPAGPGVISAVSSALTRRLIRQLR